MKLLGAAEETSISQMEHEITMLEKLAANMNAQDKNMEQLKEE